ncbi:hypothetical protein MIR68_010881 [Amoeboaphelidium protococcarum]|nr:hypothetical protein MIR68_010881 [Amoeboaphelidium protococcarum]
MSYEPVPEKYLKQLALIIEKDVQPRLEQLENGGLSFSDFITEDAFYKWLDRAEQKRQSPSFAPIVVEYLRLWDSRYPLLYEEPDESKNQNSRQMNNKRKPGAATEVNVVMRLVQAQGLLPDHKGRPRNCFAVIEFCDHHGQQQRYQTEPVHDSLSPRWNQQVSLTVNDISQSVLISVYNHKEKDNIITGQEVKEEFMGAVRLQYSQVMRDCAKSGFYSQQLQLNSQDAPKDKWKQREVSGSILVEVEMTGFADDRASIIQLTTPQSQQQYEQIQNQSSSGQASSSSASRELARLKQLQHKLISGKINLQSMYKIVLEASIIRDLCVGKDKHIFEYPIKQVAWTLSKKSQAVLDEFARVWLVPAISRLTIYLSIVFSYYQDQRVHARALFHAYHQFYESVYKKGSTWLPEHEKPIVLEMLKKMEVYTTDQIKNFKLYFPISKRTKAYDQNTVEHIQVSIDCIVLLTRMLDKNELIQSDINSSPQVQSSSHKRMAEYDLNSGDFQTMDYANNDNDDPFAKLRKPNRVKNEFKQDQVELAAAISEHDFKNGKFRFTEKLYGLIRSSAAGRFHQLAEMAIPPLTGSENQLEIALLKARELAYLLLDEIDEDIHVYSKGFNNEDNFDLVSVNLETYVKFFVLEMENLRSTAEEQIKRLGQLSHLAPSDRIVSMASDMSLDARPASVSTQTLNNEEEVVQVGLELMKLISTMSKSWRRFMKNNKSLEKSASGWFVIFLERYLVTVGRQMNQWIDNAIGADDFATTQQSTAGHHSQSALDIMTALTQSITSVKESLHLLRETDRVYEAQILSRLAQVVLQGLQYFCQKQLQKLQAMPSASAQGLSSVVWDLLGSSKKGSSDSLNRSQKKEQPDKLFAFIVGLANIDYLVRNLKTLYDLLDGSKVTGIVSYWRKDKASKSRSTSDGLSGLLRIELLSLNDIKPRSGLYGTRTNPVVLIKSGSSVIAQTQTIQSGNNVRFTTAHPRNLQVDNSIFMHGGDFNCLIAQCPAINFSVCHMAEASVLSNASEIELGRGVLPLTSAFKRKRQHAIEIKLEPQGSILLNAYLKAEGVPSEGVNARFGVAGLDDLECQFSTMKTVLSNSRYMLSVNLCQDVSLQLWPKIVKSFSDLDLLADALEFLNSIFAQLSQYLPDQSTQMIIYAIWQRCIQYPLLSHVEQKGVSENVQYAADQLMQFVHADGEGLGIPKNILLDCSSYDLNEAAKGVNLGRKLFQ